MAAYFSKKLEARRLEDKGGFGVFTCEPIHAGELLAVWEGRLIRPQELEQLSAERRRLTVQVEENLYLVSLDGPEPADLFNHSCEPNAGMSGQIALVSMRKIQPGEEVCFDYAMTDGSPYDEFDCQCGSPSCRKRITGNDWQNLLLQQSYQGYFSPYLQRRIERMEKMSAVVTQTTRMVSPFQDGA